ncbi:hypothetical protein APB90_10090 [Acinetobacter baumannii]|nr:hypothetical protein [Acinetobacter baumannii]KQE74906.1 hypothetical protein APB90_10090 [Acinetobacter baumannii]
MDKQREGFEKAYEPNPNKSPFTEVKFDEVARVYKPLDQFNPRIASSLNAAWYGWRIRQAEVDGLQAKVEELQTQLSLQRQRVKAFEEELTSSRNYGDELQKRVDAAKYYMKNIFSGVAEVDQCHLGDLLDILDGEIVDELEQALKGDQYDEHRKKAEEAISKGASLTNHRIEL